MSLREEQCKKVCRILDDVLANRPTERDSLIVAVQLAFKSLSEPHWIPVTERLPEVGQDVMFSVGKMYCAEGCLRSDGDWCQFRWNGIIPKHLVDAWRELPEPYKGVTE